jgi:cysteinyl-tRNA synthetase
VIVALVLRIFNSLTHRKEPFASSVGAGVKFFVCGPTVYDYVHLGHARTYLAFDMITRYLQFRGYKVTYVMNITDVADRLIQKAEELKRDPLEIAREYEAAFKEDMRALGIKNVASYERASDYIPQIISQITGLIGKGVAYETETGVYFEVGKFPAFGQLSGQTREELGLRRLELCSSKRNVEDFSLWRKHDSGSRWDSPWGQGRPGWHVEDTAISITRLGETYDLHGGASELIFPHHEAEIAQAEALTGKSPFVKFWLHTGLLSVKGRKMSKSLGNVIRIRDALKQYSASDLRYYFASIHYRKPVVLSDAALKLASRQLTELRTRFHSFLASKQKSRPGIRKVLRILQTSEAQFARFMNDDFNTPMALKVLGKLAEALDGSARKGQVDEIAKVEVQERFRRMAHVFGFLE